MYIYRSVREFVVGLDRSCSESLPMCISVFGMNVYARVVRVFGVPCVLGEPLTECSR